MDAKRAWSHQRCGVGTIGIVCPCKSIQQAFESFGKGLIGWGGWQHTIGDYCLIGNVSGSCAGAIIDLWSSHKNQCQHQQLVWNITTHPPVWSFGGHGQRYRAPPQPKLVSQDGSLVVALPRRRGSLLGALPAPTLDNCSLCYAGSWSGTPGSWPGACWAWLHPDQGYSENSKGSTSKSALSLHRAQKAYFFVVKLFVSLCSSCS